MRAGGLHNISYSRATLISPPVSVVRGLGAAGLMPGRSHETRQEAGCRRPPDFGLAPELRRRLSALKPGRRAPAGSRDAMLDRRQDLRVRVPVHIHSPSRQAHQ